jgi:hypothetical protein
MPRGNDAEERFKTFYETINKCMLSVLKKISRSDSIIRHSSIFIRHSM